MKETTPAAKSRAPGGVLFLRQLARFLVQQCGDPKSQKAQAAGPPRAVSVAVAPVQKQDVPVYLSGLGSVTAFNTANIKSRVDGQIMKVNFREGQDVRQGDLLIEIDARPYEVQLEQMQAQFFPRSGTTAGCKAEPGPVHIADSFGQHCAAAGRHAESTRGSA